MDPIHNPFAPGAGTPPPELAGREKILTDAGIALSRVKLGKPSRSQILLGLRGVGKTVLLNRIGELARAQGYETIVIEAPEDRRLAQLLVSPLRSLLLRLSRVERSKEFAKHSLGVLRSFASVFKVEVGDIGFGVQAEVGTADTGDLVSDLPELLITVATAGKAANCPVALMIDEVQYLSEQDLGALITSVHKMSQKGLPLLVFGAGLPQTAGNLGDAKSYAERLFFFLDIGRLSDQAAREAIRTPIEQEGAEISDEALDLIKDQTRGYPYFLQEWGYHTWDVAEGSPITFENARRATEAALHQLDEGFFRVRLDRLTPREREYMRAMAALGSGPHRSGDIAQNLDIKVTAAGPLRNSLIKKGMIYSPGHGDTAFTVPMFDEFMRRTMPDWAGDGPAAKGPAKPGNRRKDRD